MNYFLVALSMNYSLIAAFLLQMTQSPVPLERDFWNITFSNVVTWLILVVGFAISQYTVLKLLSNRVDSHAEWIRKHEIEASERDRLLTSLEVNEAKLTALTEIAEKRLTRLEDRTEFAVKERRGGH